MGISKVVYGDRTLIDLTNDTVSPENLLLGETAHDASGELIVGTAATGGSSNKILKNQTLTFVNLVATVTDSDITADSNYIVYYHDVILAENAGITTVASSGVITFTAVTAPSNTIVVDIVLLDVNGGGGGGGDTYNVYGAFIDTNRIIKARTSIPQGTTTYTATEDCAVVFSIISDSNNSSRVLVDGEMVWEQYDSNGIDQIGNTLYVKKGQVVSFIQTYSSSGYYTVYGLTQGTNGIFTPIIYSDTERVVGVWRDNKPLYQRTWEFGSSVLVSYSSWTNTTVDSSDIENIITVKAKHADGTCFEGIMADPTVSGHTLVGLQTTRNGAEANVKTLTLQYTKISDVAGSGNWNTDGVPTVHYSTSEQVIGTWLGKPLYQQTVIFDTGNVASNIDFNISAYMPVNSVVRDSSFTLDFSFNGDTYHRANWGGAYVEINGVSYLSFNIGSAVYNKHVELTIKYTKTTD